MEEVMLEVVERECFGLLFGLHRSDGLKQNVLCIPVTMRLTNQLYWHE